MPVTTCLNLDHHDSSERNQKSVGREWVTVPRHSVLGMGKQGRDFQRSVRKVAVYSLLMHP